MSDTAISESSPPESVECSGLRRTGFAEPQVYATRPGRIDARYSVDQLIEAVKEYRTLGGQAGLFFGVPEKKDDSASQSYASGGIVQTAIKEIKSQFPEFCIITDVCLCAYTDHGHCGILNTGEHFQASLPEGYVLNDPTRAMLARVAISHAEAGADIVAPSAMIDGMVSAIRSGLDKSHFSHVPILSYAVKYASSYYGPFRDAAESPPAFGDRKSHQMDPANVREAQREAALDLEEGADILMVKPALAYLDVIHNIRQSFPQAPLAAYNVSGEYSMVKAAAAQGWVDERGVVLENLTAIKRAGADLILTYHAKEASVWLKSSTD